MIKRSLQDRIKGSDIEGTLEGIRITRPRLSCYESPLLKRVVT